MKLVKYIYIKYIDIYVNVYSFSLLRQFRENNRINIIAIGCKKTFFRRGAKTNNQSSMAA